MAAPAALTNVVTNTDGSGGTSISVSGMGTGTGDRVAFVGVAAASVSLAVDTAGWTLLSEVTGSGKTIGMAYKAAATDDSVQFSWTGTNESAVIAGISPDTDFSTTAPAENTNAATFDSSGTTHSVPSTAWTPTDTDVRIVSVMGRDDGRRSVTGYPDADDNTEANPGGGGDAAINLCTGGYTASSPQSTGDFTTSGNADTVQQSWVLFEVAGGTPATVTPATIATTSTLPTATLKAAAKVTPAAITTTAAFPDAAALAAAKVTPAVVATTTTLPTAQLLAAATVTPAAIATASTLPTPNVVAAATVTPTEITTTVTLPTPTASVGGTPATVTPATVATTVTVPTPAALAAALVAPNVITTVTTLPTPAALAAALAAPGTVATTSTLPAAQPSIPTTVTPAAITTASTLPTPAVVLPATVTPATVATTSALPAAAPLAAVVVTPTTITLVTTLPVPTAGSGVVDTSAGYENVRLYRNTAYSPKVLVVVTLGHSATVGFGAGENWEPVSGRFAMPTDGHDTLIASLSSTWLTNRDADTATLTAALNAKLHSVGYRQANAGTIGAIPAAT